MPSWNDSVLAANFPGTFPVKNHPITINTSIRSGRNSHTVLTGMIVSPKEDTMLTYALIVFAIGALGGLTLAGVYVLRGRLAPWALSLLHAALGAVGLLLLIYAAVTTGIPKAALAALVLL